MSLNIAEFIAKAGVVGAGGAGFPTHVKADSKVDTVVANGSECEPLLHSDQALMEHHAREVLGGLDIMLGATGATRGFIGLKAHYHEAIGAFRLALGDRTDVQLVLLGNFYPSGDEQTLVYETTGRIVPEGGIPLNVGVVVDNVETLFNVFHAAIGTPVTHRTVTVLGEVGTPGVYRFPVGTPFLRAIEAAGGALVDHPAVIDGGPMMGTVYFDLDQVVKKTTSGLIVVPKDHPHVVRRTLATPMEMLRTISMCCQCRECTDLCPRYQLGHDLEPHKVMRAIITRSKEPVYQLTQAHICCLCGICETIACPLGLSPRNVFAKVREELRTNQVPNPHHRKPEQVRHGYAYTKQPKERVLARCGMTRYNVDFPYRGEVQGIRRVEIPLLQHMGAPSIPLVKVGQTVEAGMLIAGIPQGKLGANQHASITGTVTRIGNRIVIEGEP